MTIDMAKALRDAYGQGCAHAVGFAPDTSADYRSKRDAWIAQYMARLPGAQLTQVDDVTVTVSAPPGKRAVVTLSRPRGGSSIQTIAAGQSHSFKMAGAEQMNISEGQPHSTVAHSSK